MSGSISITISGGNPSYLASWSNGSNGTTIGDLSPGSYTVTVTDASSCTVSATYNVGVASPLDLSVMVKIQLVMDITMVQFN